MGDATRAEVRALTRLGLPVALAHLGMMALGVVDVVMVGHLSEHALAAVALGNTFSWALMILGMGALHVLDPLVSQAHGAGDAAAKADALHRGVVLALLLSLPIVGVLACSRPILRVLADQPAILDDAAGYARAVAWGVPAFFLFVVVRQTLQATSVVRPVMLAVLVGNAANVVLNLGFVHGRFGLPAMGAEGSGVASTLCRLLMAAALVAFSWPKLREFWRRPGAELLRPGPYRTPLVRGMQIGVQMALEVWMFNAVSVLTVRMGTQEGSGHAVAMNLIAVSYMIPLGVGAAAATRVGNAIGRRDPGGARRAAAVATVLGVGVMVVSAATFLLAPRALASLYTSEAGVVEMAVRLLPLAALFQLFDGAQAVACGVLRGAGDTRAPVLINLFGYWAVGLPTGCVLAYACGLGPQGLWGGLTVGLAVVAVLLLRRVRRRLADEALVAAAAPRARGVA